MWTGGYFGLYVYNMSFCHGNHKLERGVLKKGNVVILLQIPSGKYSACYNSIFPVTFREEYIQQAF